MEQSVQFFTLPLFTRCVQDTWRWLSPSGGPHLTAEGSGPWTPPTNAPVTEIFMAIINIDPIIEAVCLTTVMVPRAKTPPRAMDVNIELLIVQTRENSSRGNSVLLFNNVYLMNSSKRFMPEIRRRINETACSQFFQNSQNNMIFLSTSPLCG